MGNLLVSGFLGGSGLEVVPEGDKCLSILDQSELLAAYWEGAGRGFEVIICLTREIHHSRLDTINSVIERPFLYESLSAQKMKQDIVDEWHLHC